ncbi:MAG: TadE family protein [Chloroflexota bacterium]|nr:TadE family protein [Chloroflexota bacterium]
MNHQGRSQRDNAARPLPRERGQSMVELAFSLVFLLILIAGVVDLGRAFFTYIVLRDAAQEGALYGSINPTESAEIANRANAVLLDRVDLGDVTVTSTTTGTCSDGTNTIAVEVEYSDFPITMPFLGTFVGSQSFTITANVIDTILSPPCP